MIVLADNDVLFKLAQCDLFDAFLGAFGVTAADIRILNIARFSISSKKNRKWIDEDSFACLSAFLAIVADVPVAPDPAAIAALNEQTDENIDAGEAVLFAVCPLIANAVIVTGDKKSLTGLAEAGAHRQPPCVHAALWNDLSSATEYVLPAKSAGMSVLHRCEICRLLARRFVPVLRLRAITSGNDRRRSRRHPWTHCAHAV